MLKTLDVYHLDTFLREIYALKYICENKDKILNSENDKLDYTSDDDDVFEDMLPIYEYDQVRYKNNEKYDFQIDIGNISINEQIEFTFNMDICNCFLVDIDNCYNYINDYLNSLEGVQLLPNEILQEYMEDGEYIDNTGGNIFGFEEIVITSEYIDEYMDKYRYDIDKMNTFMTCISNFIREIIDNDIMIVDVRDSKNPYFHGHNNGLHNLEMIPKTKYQICGILLYPCYDRIYTHMITKTTFYNRLKDLNSLLRGEMK